MKVPGIALLVVSLLCAIAQAEAPNIINYQGRLKDGSGNPVADNTYAVTFSLYSVPSGGSAIWTEIQTVTTSKGIFSTILGATTPFGPTAFSDSVRYLGIKVAADPEIAPRSRLASVPFALTSNNGWVDDGTVVRLSTNADYVGIGTSTPIHPLHVSEPAGGVFVSRFESSNPGAMVTEWANSSANSVWELSVAGSAGIPGWGVQPGDLYMYKQGTSFPALSLTSARNLGLGTALPRARIEAVTLDTTAGLFLAAAASNATKVLRAEYTGTGDYDAIAVYGKSTPASFYGYGGYFEGGYMGVRASAQHDQDFDLTGVFGQAQGNGAGWKIGARGSATGTAGVKYGVIGNATGSGENHGGDFVASGAFTNYGIRVTTSGPNFNYGVYSTITGTANWNRAMYAEVTSGPEVGGVGTAGEFQATGPAGVNYGIHATASGASVWNRAGYFSGDVVVDGTLFKTAGSFKIDHPLDPDNKYLQHSFVESPEMKNIYDGIVTLDAKGEATVTLPDWFGALNEDFRYQLTCVGGYAPVYISSKVASNQFSIAGGTPGLEVSWLLTGIRKDVYAEAHRIEVEVDKRPEERGKYIFPELYSKGPEMGISYRPELESRAASAPPPVRSMEKSAGMKK